MKSGPNTLDKLIKYYEHSTIDSHSINPKISGINNFNNVETADRKLIVNNKLEFWVHDKVLNENCKYFLEEQKNNENTINSIHAFNTIDNDNHHNSNILTENINIKNSYLKNNSFRRKEIQNKKKIEIQLPNNKRNNFTKQNSKDLSSKIYRKIHNVNYNTYNTICSETNEKIVNNSSSMARSKIKKKISIEIKRKGSYIYNMNRNNRTIINNSCITEDLVKIQKLKDIIKKRKLALGIYDTSKKPNDKTPNKINRMSHTKRKTYGGENDFIKNNFFINKTKNFKKKNFLNKIIKNIKIENNNKNSIFNTQYYNLQSIENINYKNNSLNNRYNTIQINGNVNNNKNPINKNKNDTKNFIKTTYLNIIDKNEYDLFFDILLWMYSKDIKKLKKFSKNIDILLNILSLANFLKIKKNFYNALLKNIDINFTTNFFNSSKWSRNKISFYALEKIIPLIKGNYNRIYALISWLKPIKIKNKNYTYSNNIIKDIIHSKDFFLVRNYIKKYKLIYSLDKDEIIELKNKFSYFIDCLDMEGIFDNYILGSNDLICIKCNTKFNSIYQTLNNTSKEEDKYNIYNNKVINGQYNTQKRYNIDKITNNDSNKICQHLIIINNSENNN